MSGKRAKRRRRERAQERRAQRRTNPPLTPRDIAWEEPAPAAAPDAPEAVGPHAVDADDEAAA